MSCFHRFILTLILLELMRIVPSSAQTLNRSDCAIWEDWQHFMQKSMQPDGRVIDRQTINQHSTSEGQSYALFFALVANDRDSFSQILRWTENNLANGDLSTHLPAWWWGQRSDHSWGILDSNSASDADLWITYTLAEAGRLWQEPRYTALAQHLETQIRHNEVVDIPGLGAILIPAPRGFHPSAEQWRLNPSYLPLALLRGLSRDLNPQWSAVAKSSLNLLVQSSPLGLAPDWITYDTQKGWLPDHNYPDKGSYAAVRVYLWAGMLAPASPDAIVLQKHLLPILHLVGPSGTVPEQINTQDASSQGIGPAGFLAALLPLLNATSNTTLLLKLQHLLPSLPDSYYNQVLYLFATGWINGYFHFTDHGQLLTRWTSPCTVRNYSSQ